MILINKWIVAALLGLGAFDFFDNATTDIQQHRPIMGGAGFVVALLWLIQAVRYSFRKPDQ